MAIACPSLEQLPPPPPGRRGWPWTEETQPDTPDPAGLPLISVVTPSFNSGAFLEEAMRSVLLQGYPKVEFIIMDGGSTDQTAEVAVRYRPWLAEFVSQPDRGQSHALNKGLARAGGDLVFWLNADDAALPGAFQAAGRAHKQNPEAGLIVGGGVFMDAQGKELSREPAVFTSWQDYVFRRCMIRQWCTFFRREVLEECGGLDESLHYCMDRDLLTRVTKRREPFLVDEFFCAYRVHGAAKTRRSDNLVERIAESDRSSLAHLAGTPVLADFKRERSLAWLGFSRQRRISRGQRLACMSRALRLRPRALFTPDFLAAAVTLLAGDRRP